jgi:chemotaxis protein histidine kinase CheA
LATEEARKQESIRMKEEAKAAAEQRVAEQARLREERRQEQEAKVREAAEKRAAEQESRKAAAEQRAAEQARLREERRQEQEAKAREATEKRAAEQESRKAAAEAARLKAQKDAALKKQESKTSANTARPSFSVTGSPSLRVSSQRVSVAPRGVPTIVNWRKRQDSGISGRIYGSPNFNDGYRVETSEITFGEIANGNVVKTSSGSRYFLSDVVPSSPNTKGVDNLKSARPGATISLTKFAKERDAKKAMDAVKEAKPRSTFSLFGMLSDETAPSGPPAKKPGFKRSAPRGVPSLKRWRCNRDGSITGSISGSPNFKEGEQITTSPIATGSIDSKELVTTGSGSRYFLD